MSTNEQSPSPRTGGNSESNNAADKPKRPAASRSVTLTVGALIIGLAAGLGIGYAVHGSSGSTDADKKDTVSERDAEAARKAEELDRREKELDEREAALAGPDKSGAKSIITEGLWTVGVDITPGTYRMTQEAKGGDETCYWAIEKTGSNGELIANDLVSGGYGTVTLTDGQDFRTQDCGSWALQK